MQEVGGEHFCSWLLGALPSGGGFEGAELQGQCPGAGSHLTWAAPHGLATSAGLSGAVSCAGSQLGASGGAGLEAGPSLCRFLLQDPCPAFLNPAVLEILPAPTHPAQPNTSVHGEDGAGRG